MRTDSRIPAFTDSPFFIDKKFGEVPGIKWIFSDPVSRKFIAESGNG
jgi:hypothetical protein